MTDQLAACCARGDCCERRAGDDEDDLEAVAEHVVKGVVEAHLEILMSCGTAGLVTESVPAMAEAITEVLARMAPGAAFRLVVHGVDHRGGISTTHRVGAHDSAKWPEDTISVTVARGLCVISGPRYSWIVHAPATQLAVTP